MKLKTLKKSIALIAVGCMIASTVVGCGQKEGESGTGSKEEAVTLTVWGDPDNQAVLEEPFKEINTAFEKEHPNIKIDYQWSGSFDNINVAVQSDSLPDLFWVQGNKSTKMEELAKNDDILCLDSYNIDSSRYPQDAINYATVDGSVYCNYPGFFDYAVVYYNKQIFEDNNLEVPEKLSDFVAACETLSANGVTPISGPGLSEWDRYWLIQATAPVMCADTMEAIKNHEEPDYAPMAEMFDLYRTFSEKGYMGQDFQGTDLSGAQLAFTNGKAAMIVDGTWNNAVYRDLDFEVGAFAMSDENGVRFGQSGPSNFTTYAVASKCEHPDEAVEYLKFLSSPEAEQIMEDNVGNVPLADGIEAKDELVKQFADVDEIGSAIYHVLTAVSDENGKPEEKLLGEVVPKLMTSEIDGNQAVEIIKEEIAKSSNK